MQRSGALFALSVLLSSAVLIAAPGASGAGLVHPVRAGAEPLTAHPLPFHEIRDVLGDPHQERAFVTGADVDAVAVLDSRGSVDRMLEGLPDATRLALDDTGSRLFVTLGEPEEIAVVDPETGSTTRHPLPGICPDSITYGSGLVWMNDRCTTTRLVSFDPETGVIESYPTDADHMEQVVAHPSVPNTLFTSGYSTLKWHLSPGAAPTITASRPYGVGSLTITRQGNVMAATGNVVQEMRGSDLAPVAQYPIASEPEGASLPDLALAPDGTLSAAWTDGRWNSAVRTYSAGESVMSRVRPLPGLGFLADDGTVHGGDNLYVVARDSHLSSWHTTVIESPTAPASHPLGTRRLRVPHVDEVVAAPGSGRTFVSTGPDGSGILVLDARGMVETVIDGLPGPSSMVLAPDGDELLVMLLLRERIAVIDTRTLTVRWRHIQRPPNLWPWTIASTAGLLWSGALTNVTAIPHSMVIRPDGRVDETPLDPPLTPGHLYASYLHPNRLFEFGRDRSRTAPLSLWRARADSAPARTYLHGQSLRAEGRDLAFTPDRLHVLAASAGLSHHPVLDAETLTLAGLARTDAGPAAVAVRSDGLVAYGTAREQLAVHTHASTYEWRVKVQRSTWGRVVTKVWPPQRSQGQDNDLVPRGLAFGQRHLYALFGTGDDFVVRRIKMPPLQHVTVTRDRLRYRPGDDARIVAHVARGSQTRVHFTQTFVTGRTRDLGWHRVDKHGNASITVTVRKGSTIVAAVGRDAKQRRHRTTLELDPKG